MSANKRQNWKRSGYYYSGTNVPKILWELPSKLGKLPDYERMLRYAAATGTYTLNHLNIVILNHCYIIMTWYILIFTIIISIIAPPGMRWHILPALCCIPRRCCVLRTNMKPICHSCSCSSDSLTGFMPPQQVVVAVRYGAQIYELVSGLFFLPPPPYSPFNHQTLSCAGGCVGMYLGKAMPWAKC